MYGRGVLGDSQEENAALKKSFIEDRAFLLKRVMKGFETASALPGIDSSRVAVIGFGFGGICALDLARSGVRLNAVVSIYGHFDSPKNVAVRPIEAKVMILHGFKDSISPLAELYAFQEEMDQIGVDWQTHFYGGAFHAFASPTANDPDSGILYDPVAAERAWSQVEQFLKEVLKMGSLR